MMPQGVPWQLGLLLLVVPVQYFLTTWKPTSDLERRDTIHQLAWKFESWRANTFNAVTWKKWFQQKYNQIVYFLEGRTQPIYGDDDEGESPAVEVLDYLDKNGHFAGSSEPRIKRPSNVKFRVGQVIKHKVRGYRGIIIGWDETAKAPEDWFRQMHPADKPILHPQIDDYFEMYDGTRYLARPWLKHIYPHDQ
ncbi:uncharacterized protein LOC117100401 isoform X2 [Anneissia japonica]|uniref:uncharacterized protein LOC117100401 isoform X2 n=1 Tax=Anneissia japonica TaxID=1529436 RepID=UPI0014256D5E|nr:uncharacterized protein LOC117100401 isoform X2 [Anneissia japonica]